MAIGRSWLAVASLCAATACSLAQTKQAPLYGISADMETAQLVQINTVTGNRTKLGRGAADELNAQQLATLDHNKGIYYVLDFNISSRAPQLIGFNIKGAVKGTIAVDITLNLSELAFVGVGQLVCADPLTGRLIISGHDSTVMGHHIFWVDPFGADPSKATTIAKIAAPAVYLLGGSCAVDWDAKIFYAPMVLPPADDVQAQPWPEGPYNASLVSRVWQRPFGGVQTTPTAWHVGTGAHPQVPLPRSSDPPPPPVPPFSVSLVALPYEGAEAGKWERVTPPTGKDVSNLAYDETKKELVGFGGVQNADGTYTKTLESMKRSTAGTYTFKTIGKVPLFTGEMGPITTIDSKARVHYSMLAPPPKPWQKSDGCAATGFPCKAGTSCCMMPPGGPACFNVPSCSDMHGGIDLNAPFYLAQLNLDSATTAHKAPPLCTIGANDCPWSLECDETQV